MLEEREREREKKKKDAMVGWTFFRGTNGVLCVCEHVC
jgi:hypothetical protein